MEVRIGIKKDYLAPVAMSLSKILADEFVLSTKTLKAHWNVEGADFYSKHKMFESQHKELNEIVDALAERIRSLGHYAPGTLKEFLQLTHLSEETRKKNTSIGYISDLLMDHESILVHLRENINNYVTAFHDAGSSDYITGLMETHEKFAWMLRSHLV